FTATALAGGVRVAELEEAVDALGDIIDLGAVEDRCAFLVDKQGDAFLGLHALVVLAVTAGVVEHIHETGAAGLTHTQAQASNTLTSNFLARLGGGFFCHGDAHVTGGKGLYAHVHYL